MKVDIEKFLATQALRGAHIVERPPVDERGPWRRSAVTFDEAEQLTRTFEVVEIPDLPEGRLFYAVLRGPRTPENWPIDWFVSEGDGDVRLVVGEGATAREARLCAAGKIVDSADWRPGMGLREAERALYPGLSCIDEEKKGRPSPA